MKKDKTVFDILVIEDNPGDFVLVEDYLKEQIQNPSIQRAVSFVEAHSILSSGTYDFDVILLDLTLPDKSGKELIKDILPLTGESPLIVLTGYSDIDFSIQSISEGVSDYLLKDDLNSAALYKSIIYCIERKRSIEQLKESEKRYSDLFRLNPQPMWVYDPESLQIVQVNKAAVDHYGYSEKEFLAMTILDLRPPDEINLLKKTLTKTNTINKQINEGKFTHLKKNKELIEVEIYSNFIKIKEKEFKIVIATDVTEKNLVAHRITRAIIKTQEDERYEIGGELHDNVCQILATSQMSLGLLKKSLDPSAIPLFNRSNDYIALATEEIRNLSHRLAPAFLNDTTLEEAFGMLLKTSNIEGKFEISLYFADGFDKANIDKDLQLNLYRILQEQLRNIVKYSKASIIEVDVITTRSRLKMRISDNGIGFDVNLVKGGIGLSNIRRRVELFLGRFEIFSSAGEGTELLIDIPLSV